MSTDTDALWNALTTKNTQALVEQIRAAGPAVVHAPADDRCVYCDAPTTTAIVDHRGNDVTMCAECASGE